MELVEETGAHVRPPKQKRSRETLDRILTATETLLETRLLEDITLADILRESRVSVGAFYARFANKDALVPCLYDRYDRWLTNGASRVLRADRWSERRLDWKLRLLFRYAVRVYRMNRGLLRALALHVRVNPVIANPEHRTHRADLYSLAAAALLEPANEVTHPDAGQAIRFGLLMAGSTFREKVFYDHSPQGDSVTVDDRRLADETARAVAAYLTSKGAIP